MSRSPTYKNLRDWVLGRISRHAALRSSQRSMPGHMLGRPPEYLLCTELDAADMLRELREAGVIASHSKRWYLRPKAVKR